MIVIALPLMLLADSTNYTADHDAFRRDAIKHWTAAAKRCSAMRWKYRHESTVVDQPPMIAEGEIDSNLERGWHLVRSRRPGGKKETCWILNEDYRFRLVRNDNDPVYRVDEMSGSEEERTPRGFESSFTLSIIQPFGNMNRQLEPFLIRKGTKFRRVTEIGDGRIEAEIEMPRIADSRSKDPNPNGKFVVDTRKDWSLVTSRIEYPETKSFQNHDYEMMLDPQLGWVPVKWTLRRGHLTDKSKLNVVTYYFAGVQPSTRKREEYYMPAFGLPELGMAVKEHQRTGSGNLWLWVLTAVTAMFGLVYLERRRRRGVDGHA